MEPIGITFVRKILLVSVQKYVKQDGLKLNGTQQLLFYADDVIYWAEVYIL
jgi:hypothetical protein